ncbi:hypothetical protein VFPFJ_09708 [Purpureocillium lilacinum]|uniref:Uncharacterized protein n=1 Tax=Purpureocillium lilacinum TaxID=33203 RepID=A0A179GVB9_PURLI|nr:hypothetical protein VFPFJ_09708 [Purpureocillium lilacinum]OAQ81253.1 hypothetical protein VFPFJ_09708 [Purpureocillium lilacinum]GJN69959.1 hypothetical protein PLICBS_004011 [Purpureocillium lilacinum]GJN86799.1 hypothetical protein PLIIFM63780_010381 [Purpureocillium lilacinum]
MALGERAMERLRADLLSRARRDRQDAGQEMTEAGEATRARAGSEGQRSRSHLPRLNTLRVFGRGHGGSETPKSPEPESNPTMPLYNYDAAGPSPQPHPLPSPTSAAPLLPQSRMPLPPEPVATSPNARSQRSPTPPIQMTGAFPVPDSTTYGPTDTASGGSPARGADTSDDDDESGRPHPKRFLFCFPWVKSRRMRSQILTCFVSGMFLLMLLAIYLGLTLTKNIRQGELTIMIILVILTAAAFFAYSFVRLLLLVFQPDRKNRRRRRGQVPDLMAQGGYVVPPKPIPVLLARDEEVAGAQSEASKLKPPAYGLWRESVRVDPDRLFWQRNADANPNSGRPETRSGPRPPSYASDDGVSYMMDVRPRSIAPPPSSSSIYSSDFVRSATASQTHVENWPGAPRR